MTVEEEKLFKEMADVLRGIVNGCVHPQVAIRAVMVDLKPIRKILNQIDAKKETKQE